MCGGMDSTERMKIAIRFHTLFNIKMPNNKLNNMSQIIFNGDAKRIV